jgi:hypothetical protein
MKAKLKDLSGKYYGTFVEINTGFNDGPEIKFWFTFQAGEKSYQPSDRELFNVGLTRQDWDNDINCIDEDGNKTTVRTMYCDLACVHFEDQFSYETALNFVSDFNKRHNSNSEEEH